MAYYDGPCSCASVGPSLFYSGIISPPANATLIANQPVKIKWESNGTATHFSLRLRTYTGRCYEAPSQHERSCSFGETLDQVVDRAPDTGEAMWTPGSDLESRNDYILSGYLQDGTTSYIHQQGFYTILKKEGDTPLMLPTQEEINRNLTQNAEASSSSSSEVPRTSNVLSDMTSATIATSTPTGAADSKVVDSPTSLTLLLYSGLALLFG